MRGAFAYLLPVLIGVMAPVAAQQAPGVDRLEELIWQGAANAGTTAAYGVYLRRYPNGAFAPQARDAIAKLGGTPPPPPPPPPPPAAGEGAAAAAPAAPPAATPVVIASPPVPPSAPEDAVAPPPATAPTAPTVPNGPPAPPPAVAPTAPTAATAADPAPFQCRPVFAGGAAPLERAAEAELDAYLDATRVNTVDRYRRYLELFPTGAFAAEVRALVEARTARANAFAATPVPGPAAAKARGALTVAADDYPAQALRDRQQGAVGAVWEVAADGCVQACRIEQASGSAALDAATCRLITVRGRYDPARDSSGKPIASVASTTINWTLPR